VCVCVSAAVLAGPGKSPTSAQKELRLIQSKSDIENPRIVVEAVPLISRMFLDANLLIIYYVWVDVEESRC